MPITIRKFSIGSEQLESDSVYGAKIADDAIGSEHIEDNAISYAAQIKDGIVGYAELTAGVQGSIALGSVPPADSIGTTELKEPSVGSSQIYDDAVGSQHIDDDAIGSSIMIADDVIASEHIADDAIGSSAMVAADVIMGYHIADDAIGSEHIEANGISYAAQIKDGIIGYAELTSGLQGSFAGGAERPYAGDDSEITITGSTPGTIKTASVLKHTYTLPVGSIKIAAQMKASAGTYTMRVQLGTVHKLTFTGTETAYKLHYGSFGVGGESDGVLALQFMIVNTQGAGVSYNKLVDIITVL